MDTLNINAFDLFFFVIVVVGILRGKKRGISEELLDVAQWLAIVFVGAIAYRPVGTALVAYTKVPIMWGNIIAYIIIAAALFLLFNAIRRAVGEKLVHSDAFGRFEYYLGMLAGAVRFTCIVMFLISILHAKYTTPAERAAQKKMQQDNFGSITLPTLESLQESIFFESQVGSFIEKNIRWTMIEPVPPRGKTGTNIYERRSRTVEDAMK